MISTNRINRIRKEAKAEAERFRRLITKANAIVRRTA